MRRSLGRYALFCLLSTACVACESNDDPSDEDADMMADAGEDDDHDGERDDANMATDERDDDDDADTDDNDGDDADDDDSEDEAPSRPHDDRTFSFDPSTAVPFEALEGLETDRWAGEIDGAAFRIEVPEEWNGVLVMYAHGYAGQGEALRLTMPSIRLHLIEQGFAWAASSYSANYYDVRAGVEDTNRLALEFDRISKENGRPLTPQKRYIIGHSMGGHVAGAAVEKETLMTAIHRVEYDASLPMCGVMGDTELFNYYAAYQAAAHELADMPLSEEPIEDYGPVRMAVQDALFSEFPGMTTPEGDSLKGIVMNLTGGARPVFDLGWLHPIHSSVWGTFGGDGTLDGVLTASVIDTRDITYQLDSDDAISEAEESFNDSVVRLVPEADANGLRPDGLRWVPQIKGQFDVPVLSIHTLGDMFVPFSMQQIYRRRADEESSGEHLVQRAMRGAGHCEFTYEEQTRAFDDLVAWETEGEVPEGDDVLDPDVVAADDYGCAFTTTPSGVDSPSVTEARALVPPCEAP